MNLSLCLLPPPSTAKCNAQKYVQMLNELSTTAYYQFSKLVVTSTPTDIYSTVRIQFILRIHILVKLRACGHVAQFINFVRWKVASIECVSFSFEIIIRDGLTNIFADGMCSMRSQLFDVKLDGWANVLWWEWLTRNKVHNLQANYVRIHFHFVWFHDKINFGCMWRRIYWIEN